MEATMKIVEQLNGRPNFFIVWSLRSRPGLPCYMREIDFYLVKTTVISGFPVLAGPNLFWWILLLSPLRRQMRERDSEKVSTFHKFAQLLSDR